MIVNKGRYCPNREKRIEELVSWNFGQQIGVFVRERRKAAGLTQRELGELAGVGTRFISELERGKPTVRVDAVNNVVAVFGKTLGLVDASKVENAS